MSPQHETAESLRTRIKWVLLVSLLLTCVVGLLETYKTMAQRGPLASLVGQGQQQGASTQIGKRNRIIEETPYPDSPVKIVSITNSRHTIKSKEPFMDDDDWLKGLEVEVINKSEKTVTYVGIDLLFERPPEQAGQPPGFSRLTYGRNPFSISAEEAAIASKSKSEIKPIQPEQTAVIQLSDQQYEDLKGFLKDIGYPIPIEKIKMCLTTLGFDDGTAWGGSYYIRDPDAPHGWRLKEKPQGSTKKSAAFPFSESSYHHRLNRKSGAEVRAGVSSFARGRMRIRHNLQLQLQSIPRMSV